MSQPAADTAIYIHGHSVPVLRSHSWRTASNSAAYLIPLLQPQMKILDVGCGPGTITVDFASFVPDGYVTGVDVEGVLEKARTHAKEKNAGNVEFVSGDALKLPFPDASFDVAHCHQLLQHVGNPVQILREMHRVTKPGGIVAARECDFSSMTWYPPSEALNEWRDTYMRVARGNGGEPNAGRRLHVWAREAGIDPKNITCSVGNWCFQTPEDRAWWGGMWADRLVDSDYVPSAVNKGIATKDELHRQSEGWQKWLADDDGWFAVMHGQVLCRV